MSKQRGAAAERELSNILEDQYDYAALPSGGSGSGTTRPRPDVFAVKGLRLDTHTGGLKDVSDAYAIECKAWADGVGSFTHQEIEDLERFADRAGATPLVAVRPDLRSFDGWLLRKTGALHETPEGNYSIRKQDHGECLSISEVFGE